MTFIQKRLSLILCVLMAIGSVSLAGQEQRPFTIDDYANWRSIVLDVVRL